MLLSDDRICNKMAVNYWPVHGKILVVTILLYFCVQWFVICELVMWIIRTHISNLFFSQLRWLQPSIIIVFVIFVGDNSTMYSGTGLIQTPGFPNQYPNQYSREFRIPGYSGSTLSMRIDLIQMEDCYDYFQVSYWLRIYHWRSRRIRRIIIIINEQIIFV